MQLEQLLSSIITPRSNLRIQFLKLNNDGRVLISLSLKYMLAWLTNNFTGFSRYFLIFYRSYAMHAFTQLKIYMYT